MKRTTLALVSAFLLFAAATPSFAAPTDSPPKISIDGAFGFATGPENFDGGLGINFGAGYMLEGALKNLQARIDMSYFKFDRTFGILDLEYSRLPITVSARYYFPITDQFRAFAQAGVETSFDSIENYGYFAGTFYETSEDEVNLGFSPGGGVELFIVPNASIFAIGRFHVVSDTYFSMQFGGAFHF